ncbi:hypothetical protein [Shewanella glacialipiscicola]|uniref:hypothetical protein n=1 Tax=Shewanella glacialipiscicola TaxID=614069 RepID=UPI003D7B3BC3
MNKLTAVVITGLVLSLMTSITAFAKDDHKHKHYSGHKHYYEYDDDDDDDDDDHKHKHKHYNGHKHYKKVYYGKPLPSGWYKRLHRGDVLEYDIYHRGHIVEPLNRDGIVRIQVEDAWIKLDNNSRKILDIVNIITE